ncbi:MAG: hypothetical protein RI907_3362 [Pseudomonadota bacterium]|jgi:uncharacterized SAM-binding protein YcdF (DUF218 family)
MADLGMWKPVVTALLVPPAPILLMALWGGWRLRRARRDGWLWLWLSLALLWFSHCEITAIWLQDQVLRVPRPMSEVQRQALAKTIKAESNLSSARKGRPAAARSEPVAVIVLGGGLSPLAPEYGLADLSDPSLHRLRYGIWLARQLNAPLGVSGGVGWAQKGVADGPSEAEVADRIAAQDFGFKLRWVESGSADTEANADQTMALLAEQGVREVVLVSSAFHLPRAMKSFERAAQHAAERQPGAPRITITPAGTAYWRRDTRPVLAWMPSGAGAWQVTAAVKECWGLLLQR